MLVPPKPILFPTGPHGLTRESYDESLGGIASTAKTQGLDALRELLSNAPFWIPTSVQSESIERCKTHLSHEEHKFIKGYSVLCYNEWGNEQERVILITDKGYIRVKFDPSSGRILHYHTTPHSHIVGVEVGRMTPQSFSISAQIAKTQIEHQFAIRVEKKEQDGFKSINDLGRELVANKTLPYYKIYRPFPPTVVAASRVDYDALESSESAVAEEIAHVLRASFYLSYNNNNSGEDNNTIPDIKIANIVRELPGGVFSALHNKLKLGTFTKAL